MAFRTAKVADMRHEVFTRRLWIFILVLALSSEAGCVLEGREPLAAAAGATSSELTKTGISINPRPGVSLDMVLLIPRQQLVALVLLPGGPGLAEISGINIGNRRDFVSRDARVELFSGGFTEGGEPCTPGSHDTFNGIQDQVVAVVAEFIRAKIDTE